MASFKILDGVGIIPEGTKTLPPRSFANCAKLEKVEIPNSVSKIEDYAFNKCTNLKEIIIGKALCA